MSPTPSVESLFTYDSLEELFKAHIGDTRAVGRDGVRMSNFRKILTTELTLIESKVLNSNYTFTGYKQKLISKGANKAPREISIPTIRDRVTQKALCNLLHSQFSERLQPPPHTFIKSISQRLKQLGGGYSFLRIDVKNFYPSINHEFLLECLKEKIEDVRAMKLVEASISCPTGKKNIEENKNRCGIPQGLSISNILSSIYMTKLDEKFDDGKNYFRFVDDILIIVKNEDSQNLFEEVCLALKEIDLEAHPLGQNLSSKSNISSVEEGVVYLGYRVSKNAISIRDSSYKRMLLNLSRIFTDYKYNKNKKKLLWRLNLKISGCVMNNKRFGWVSFFSQSTNISQFARVDAFIQENLIKYQVQLNEGRVKKVVKAYYEHRYNFKKSNYIPKFENYSLDDMIRTICTLTEKEFNDVASWEEQDIKQAFWKYIKKETASLEKDLFEAFS